MKKLYTSLLLAASISLIGCAGGTNRTTYTTLGATEKAVVLSYDGYLDSVFKGTSRTNELPTIAKSFDAFQSSFKVAVSAASGNTNAPVTAEISAAAASILQAVNSAKGVK